MACEVLTSSNSGSQVTGTQDDRSYSSSLSHQPRCDSEGCNTHHQTGADTCTVYEHMFRRTLHYSFLVSPLWSNIGVYQRLISLNQTLINKARSMVNPPTQARQVYDFSMGES